jgi:type I restriction enzyme S subunit
LNDILLVSRGATVGRVAIINTESTFCLLGSVILLKPKVMIDSFYFFYSLKNKLLQNHFLNSSQSSAQQAIYLIDVAQIHLSLPPLKEQKEIVNYIEKETARIDAKIDKTRKIIELEKEYRTALISEAVTGKIKVTHFNH